MNIIAAGLMSLMVLTGTLPDIMWQGDASTNSAWALSMGNAGFLEVSPIGALGNPSLLGLAGSGFGVEVSGGVDLGIEKRTRLVYDTFGSSIGESEWSYNSGFQFLPGGAGISWSGGSLPSALSIGFGWTVPHTYQYSYDRVLRDDAYVLVGNETLTITGMENEFAMALALSPFEFLSIGLGGGYILGSRDVEWEVTYVSANDTDVVTQRTLDITGAVARGSFLFIASERVFVTGVVEYPIMRSFTPEVMGDTVTWNIVNDTDYDLTPPMTCKLGAVYLPGNILQSKFVAGLLWSNDGSMEYEKETLGLFNAWGVRVGVENTLPGGPTARFGFSYDRSPLASSLDRMAFTGGMAFEIEDYALDMGLSFSPNRWRQTDVSELPSFVAGDSLTVEGSNTKLMLSISRAFAL